MSRVVVMCAVLCLALLAGLLVPASEAASRMHRAARRGHAAVSARAGAPARSVASRDWLRDLLEAAPEMGLEAGLNSCGPRLNDYDDRHRRAVVAILDRALLANSGQAPDAELNRSRLIREKFFWQQLDLPERHPGIVLPTTALVDPLEIPDASPRQQATWLASRLEATPERVNQGIGRVTLPSSFMLNAALGRLAYSSRLIDVLHTYTSGMDLEAATHDRLDKASQLAGTQLMRYEVYLKGLRSRARGDARPEPRAFESLLKDGYGITGSPAQLEERLRGETRRAQRELDSLGRRVDSTQSSLQVLAVLRGAHPAVGELLPAVVHAFRASEEFGRSRWPGMPAGPLEIAELSPAQKLEGAINALISPRPLRAAAENPAYTLALPDLNAPVAEQDAVLGQNSFFYDSVLATRSDVPGEAMLWALHRSDPGARLWAAGAPTFQGWGFFAQGVAGEAGEFRSSESRMFDAWSRLIFLARGLEDLKMGRRLITPEAAAIELSQLTGIADGVSRDYVRDAMESPGGRAAAAARTLLYEDQWRALRSRGTSEAQALRKLAETALYPPPVQARLLGL